ncbi:hypothetical protein LC55x_1577 [Lysobacter capsici]|nr:hypothetical protein LC55x_1577 [Lysobacter capsici]
METRLGTAMANMIAATVTATINSSNVNPAERFDFMASP